MPTGKKMPPGELTRAVARVLKESADLREISQAQIGKQNVGSPMYISQSQVSRFFAGLKTIDVDQLNGICRALDVSPVEVIDRAEDGLGGIPVRPVAPIRPLRPTQQDADLDAVARAEVTDQTDGQNFDG